VAQGRGASPRGTDQQADSCEFFQIDIHPQGDELIIDRIPIKNEEVFSLIIFSTKNFINGLGNFEY
jgi:hypothetical protein